MCDPFLCLLNFLDNMHEQEMGPLPFFFTTLNHDCSKRCEIESITLCIYPDSIMWQIIFSIWIRILVLYRNAMSLHVLLSSMVCPITTPSFNQSPNRGSFSFLSIYLTFFPCL